MHKKEIKGKVYFYTSYRDKNGKVITKYLGSSRKEAKKNEDKLKHRKKKKKSRWFFFIILTVLLLSLLLTLNASSENLTVLNDSEIILTNLTPSFEINQETEISELNLSTTEINETIELTYTENDSNLTKEELTYNENYENITEELAYNEIEENMTFDNIIFEENITQETNTTEETTPAIDNTALPETNTTENATESSNQTSRFSTQGFTTEDYQTSDTGICDEGDEDTTCNLTTPHVFATNQEFNFTELYIQPGGSIELTSGANLTLNASIIIMEDTANITAQVVNITAENLTINVGAIINVNTKGFGPGAGPGKGGNGGGLGYPAGGAGYGGGGAFGYYSGTYYYGGDAYGNFSEPLDLGSGGGCSSSNCAYGPGGPGGGLIVTDITNTLTINGEITSEGGNGTLSVGGQGGGGSGGSILLKASTITGTGNITANGGPADTYADSNYAGSGGGGRIAIWYNTNEFGGDVNASTSPYGIYRGEAGTIYYWDMDDGIEEVVVDNLGYGTIGVASGCPLSGHLDFLNVSNRANATVLPNNDLTVNNTLLTGNSYIDAQDNVTLTESFTISSSSIYSSANLVIANIFEMLSGTIYFRGLLNLPTNQIENITLAYGPGGLLEEPDNSLNLGSEATLRFVTDNELNFNELNVSGQVESATNSASTFYAVNISAVNMTILEGGNISVEGRGNTSGPGKGGNSNNYAGAGGGYGGGGAPGYENGYVYGGNAYGNFSEPLDLGSAGGKGNWGTCPSGGSGGGLIILNVSDTLNVSGVIDADGGVANDLPSNCFSGGGSGGSVLIKTNILTGSGNITAFGGASNKSATSYYGGSGGGGRIAIWYYVMDEFYADVNASTSDGYYDGDAGTIYYLDQQNNVESMTVDNNGLSSSGLASGTPISGHLDFLNVSNRANATINVNDEANISNIVINGNSILTIFGNLTTGKFDLVSGTLYSLGSNTTIQELSTLSGSIIFGGGTLKIPINLIENVTFYYLTGGILDVPDNSLQIESNGVLQFNTNDELSFEELNVSGLITSSTNSVSTFYAVNISANNITITETGAIDVAAKGNASVVSSGATNGYGPGGGTYGGGSNNYCGGGGYGGLGGNGTGIDARGGLTYGSMITPLDLGSSGAASSGRGTCTTGAGGGLIRINASDTLNISGNINASGGDALTCGGGGSGGSIYLTATRFVGTGNIEAKGGRGNSTSYDGGGGGGRIALHYGTFDYEGTNSTAGGTGSNTGMTGTVYIADLDPPNITLVLPENNSNVESPGEVNFTFIASSDKPVNNCTIFINDEPSTSNQTDIILNTDHNISIILIPNTYTWNVRCYDETEKEGISDTWNFTFTLDETSPTINLLLPEDSTTNVTSNVIDFTYNVTDASDVNCSLVIQNGDDISINVTTDFLLDKDVNQNLTTYLDNAEYNWTINCTDAANNEGTAEWRNLSVLQYAAPSVILIEPENFNSTVELTSQIIFNCTATSDRGLVNITLYGNWQSIGWHANETTTVNGNSAEANFNKIIGYSDIFTDRRIRWNCKAEDTEGREAFASSDYYFSGWDFGSYGNSSYNNQSVGLDSDSLGEYSAEGNYTSKVFDAGSNANWNLLQWLPATPYGQELPNNGENETSKYPNGADMSGNVLLMHMNEESGNVIDNSGMGNTGTVNGEVVYGNVGKFNNSISFNGSGDYIEVSDTASLDITNELTIEAWVNNDKDSTTNKFQTIISKWGYTETMGSGSFQGLNISQINGYDTVGYDGAVFDGRYLYLVPVANATGSSTTGGHGIFLRYDTQAEFTNESFIAYDASRTDGLVAEGYHGGVYDGRYIYFAPYRNSSTATATEGYHAVALRYDTQGGFTNAASWTAYDASYTGGIVTTGYYDAVFDGRYVYYVPLYNGSTNGYHGVVLRYDTTKNFTDPESWDSYNAGYTNSTTTMGYLRGVFDGKYVYFIPYYAVISGTAQYHGNVLRYDTTKEFNDMTAWDGYNAGNISGLNTKGYTGAVYDGRYIYFSQYYDGTTFNSNILRYDTWEDFGKSSSWIAYDADAGVGNSACVGYFNMEFDGRYAYFLPYYNGSGSSHGNILRYDTTQNFTSSAAWSCYDASNSINCGGNCKAYIGSGFDGRYIYMTPYYNGVYHDMMLRFDTTSSNSSYRLMYSDIQTKDAVLTSPSFTINTAENHTYSATSFTNISSGWHHIAGVFNGTGVRIYIDGVLQGDNPAAGTIAVNVAELTIGKLTESIGYFNGSIDEIVVYNRSLSDDEIRDHYMRGAAKLNFTVRSCNDAECDVEPWSGDYDNWTENNISLLDINRYFQYKAYFYTENTNFTPLLHEVNISYGIAEADITPPTVILENPSNDSVKAVGYIDFTYNVTDQSALDNCSLLINDEINATDTTMLKNIAGQNFTVYLTVGQYNWAVNCTDNVNNIGTSGVRVVNLPNISISLTDPTTNTNVEQYTLFNFTVNVSCSDANCGEINVSLDPNAWWNTDWSYRQQIDLSLTSAITPAGYPVKIILNSSNTGTNFNWSRECEDIRFVNGSNDLQLSYWIESCNTTDATIWVNIDDNITTSGPTIYMYYGNNDVNNESNGTTTFDFFEDFEGSSLSTTKWHEDAVNNIDHSFVNGKLKITGGTTSSNNYWIYDSTDTGDQHTIKSLSTVDKITVEWEMTTENEGDMGQVGIALTDSSNLVRAYLHYADGSGGNGAVPSRRWLNETGGSSESAAASETVKFKIQRNGTTIKFYIDDLLKETSTLSVTPVNLSIAIGTYAGYSFLNISMDNIRIYNYVSDEEPTYTMGEEQTQTKNLITTSEGAMPFYINYGEPQTSNPQNITLKKDESILVMWQINATGSVSATYEFYSYGNSTSEDSVGTLTDKINITITGLADTTPPTINLEEPTNNAYNDTTNMIDFTYNVSDDGALANCSLIINDEINMTDTTMTKDTAGQNFTLNLNNGEYNWSINCTDNSNNIGASETRNITIDITPPDISFVDPTPQDAETINTSSVTINVSVSENVSECILVWDPWWDTNWQYRQKINLSVASDATPENYQINIILNSTNNGTNFNWSRECEDIRFVNGADTTQLPYWIESCDTTNQNASIWVKVDQNITTTPSNIHMYYGNDDATNNSNGDSTFELFDDFEGTELDATKWTNFTQNGGTLIVSDGYVNFTTITTNDYARIRTNNTFFENSIFEISVVNLTVGVSGWHNYQQYQGYYSYMWISDSRKWRLYNGTNYTESLGSYQVTNGNYRFKSYVNSSTSRIEISGSLTDSAQITGQFDFGNSLFYVENAHGGDMFLDWIRIRKYSVEEPITVFENEENYSGKSIVNYTMEVNNADENTWANYTVMGLTDGTNYTYWVSCNDTAGNSNQTEIRSVIYNSTYGADTTPPDVYLESPEDGITNTTTNMIDFTYNVSDDGALANCSLIINDEINMTDTTMTKDTAGQNFTLNLNNGEYNWSINCTDNSNNIGASETRNISINVEMITLNITLELNKTTAAPNELVLLSGYLNFSNGTYADNANIGIYLDDTLLTEIESGTNWWNTSWSQRKKINIEETSGAELNNYQVLIVINSSNFEFQNALPDGNDTRFVNSSNDEIPFWIENWSSDMARIWVKVPTLTAGQSTTVYMYYGNSNADNKSDSSAVFNVFDDIDDGSVSDWTEFDPGGIATMTASNNTWVSPPYSIRMYDSSTGYGSGAQKDKLWGFNDQQIVELWYFNNVSDGMYASIYIYGEETSDINFSSIAFNKNGTVSYYANETVVIGNDFLPETWYKFVIKVNFSSQIPTWGFEVYNDSYQLMYSYEGLRFNSTTAKRGDIMLYLPIEVTGEVYGDNLFTRNYSSPEPVVTVLKEEVTTDANGHYNYTLRAPSSAGNYTIKVNTSYQGYYAENEQNFTVQQPENNIPMITSIQYEATVSPLENTTTQISINYTVNDDDGTSDVDNTKHQLIINFSSGETKTNTTCSTSDSGNERTYTCIVEMEFWQPPGTWSINATACDYSNACAESVNETFTYQTLTAMTAEQTSITFPDSYPGQPNVKASSSITIINTGNVNSTTVDVRGFDLKGVDDESIFWDVDNFTAKITDDCGGDQLINNTYVSVTSASLPAGELSTEELFFCITTTPDIKAQTYNTTDELWNIRIT